MRGLQISQGDEVILAGYDFKGNFLNVLTFGALPILVDVSPQSGQLDLQRVEAAISSRTRAVIASHLHGGVVDLVRLRQLADSHGFAIIEDACQMPGAPLAGLRAGMSGDVGVISFGGSKLLSAGRGGAVLTNRADVAARIRKHVLRGNSAYPLSELQAAVLLPQLEQLDARRARRSAVVADLFARLAAVPMLAPFSLPTRGVEPDYYKVVLRYDASACGGLSREMFAAAMRAEGMAVSPGFRALHLIHARSRFRAADELTQATLADQNWLVLHHPLLLEGVPAVDEFLAAAQKIQAYADQLRTVDAPRSTQDTLWEMDT
ncbi:MAG: hypothetical protein B7Z55_08810 [Planctomycetales bacterium 12-60-4]|nr:MAG: hypothetical protein B7Z55_08810 [Planctomycetales bacterium 12-60-4]